MSVKRLRRIGAIIAKRDNVMKRNYFYILECKDGSLYSGVAKDLEKRIRRHNAGKASKYTRGRRPVKLAYYEEHGSWSAARKRENGVKRWRREKRKSLIRRFPSPPEVI